MIRPVLLVLAVPALLGATPPQPTGVPVTIVFTEVRSLKGVVRVCMAREASDFPDCPAGARAYRASVATGAHEVRFAGVAPGRYAIALLHDENANGKVDKVLGLMPKEGFGFSRDAPVQMGPPKFAQAAVVVGEQPLRLSIRMRYLL